MNNPRNLFREFNDEKLEQVRTHPYFTKLREKTIAKAEEYMVTEPPIVKFSMIHLYVTTGNRKIFERVYNDYGSRMHCYFLAYLITNDDKYISCESSDHTGAETLYSKDGLLSGYIIEGTPLPSLFTVL